MNETPPPPDELKKKTSPAELFKKFAEVEVAGQKFRIRRMNLAEELEWYGERERVFADENISQVEKIVNIWEKLLQKVVEHPRLPRYVDELPAPVVAKLVEAVTELHLWNMDFRSYRRESG